MYVKVNKPSSNNGGNKGSCSVLTDYLSKEDKSKLDYITDESLSEMKNFYDKDNNEINVFEATEIIDKHSKGLEKSDTKYYMITINPSDKELEYLKNISDKEAKKTNQDSNDVFKNNLMNYTRNVMNEYAKNFDRELNGRPLNVDDLNYVARIETERTYKYNDPAVRFNKENAKTQEGEYLRNSKGQIIKEGMKKEGNNEHIHVVVSRYDASKSMKLSPASNSKGESENHVLNGNKVQVGFNRNEFSINSQKAFDLQFDYERSKEFTTERSLENYNNQKSLSDALSKGGSIIGKDGEINAINLAQKVSFLTSNLMTDPITSVKNIAEAGKEQFKSVAIPELDSNPIKEAQQKLDLKQQTKDTVKSAITSGGLDRE